MGKFRYFELSEFIASSEAKKRGIDNTPSFEVVDHLSELCGKILDPLRASYGKPITVTSGYRCPKLNQVVGGVATSAHKTGYGADLQTRDLDGFMKFLVEWLRATKTKFDQVLFEKKGKTRWVHVSLYNTSGQQRGMISTINA